MAERRAEDLQQVSQACGNLGQAVRSYKQRHRGSTPTPLVVIEEILPTQGMKRSGARKPKRRACGAGRGGVERGGLCT